MNLIVMIETCGSGNCSDTAFKISRNASDSQCHFGDIRFSPLGIFYSNRFQ